MWAWSADGGKEVAPVDSEGPGLVSRGWGGGDPVPTHALDLT